MGCEEAIREWIKEYFFIKQICFPVVNLYYAGGRQRSIKK
jgi:hypothetical protein